MKKVLTNTFDNLVRFVAIRISWFYKILYLLPNKKTININDLVKESYKPYQNIISIIFKRFVLIIARYSKGKSLIEKEVTYFSTNAFSLFLNVNEFTQCNHYLEAPNAELIKLVIKGGNTFIDIGANVGFFSLLASQHFGQVLSFEPTPTTIQSFKRNIASNNIDNVDLVECGLSDKEGIMTFNENPLNAGGNSLEELNEDMVDHSQRTDWASYEIEVSTFDKIISNRSIKSIDLVKIDVEGHEPNVIKGSLLALNKFQPLVFIEIGRQKSHLKKILEVIPEIYKPYHPSGKVPLTINDQLPWDVLFIPKNKFNE